MNNFGRVRSRVGNGKSGMRGAERVGAALESPEARVRKWTPF